MNILKKSLCIILAWSVFLISFPVKVQSQDLINVAVLDLEGRGISALEAATLTDRLRSEMVSVGAFQVVERGQMEMILQEQGFQQTGCSSAECAVEVGKLLGVSKMITGNDHPCISVQNYQHNNDIERILRDFLSQLHPPAE